MDFATDPHTNTQDEPEVRQDELAVRCMEAMTGRKRPAGATPHMVLMHSDPETRAAFLRIADAAFHYIMECLSEEHE